MSSPAFSPPTPASVHQELARREQERRRAERDPAWFLDHVSMVDERTAETFRFHLQDPASGWYWQREALQLIEDNSRSLFLKARQLGMTWLAAGWGLWKLLYAPGSSGVVYRQKEDDAGEIIERVWDMWLSLEETPWLRNQATVISPTRGSRPSTTIEWQFPDGRLSRLRGMASTASAGHGKTLAFALLDEFARIDRASEIMKAVQPAVGSKGKIIIISTANGRANPETGEGNFFSYLWENAANAGFCRHFLPWMLHPDRDQDWYQKDPEVQGLRLHERHEQWPSDAHEAFVFTDRLYFDPDALRHYAKHLQTPRKRIDFTRVSPTQANIRERDNGQIRVYHDPKPGHSYAIGADVATGRGADYSAACVLDLSDMTVCAETRQKIDSDLFAYQLHYLGRYYNTARLAVEVAGGYGEAVIIPLRDGREGRPPYPNLYRHTEQGRIDYPTRKVYGFPTNMKTRPLLFSNLEKAIREKHFPALTDETLFELEAIVEGGHPTPAAREGANDDRVIALGIALELYRQLGHHPDRHRPKRKQHYRPSYPWQTKTPVRADD